MADDRPSVRFFGDLGDPWVVAIADALPGLDSRNDTPYSLPDLVPDCDVAVVHRSGLGPGDAIRLVDWRKRGTKVILCAGPNVRARDLEWAASADVVLSEATAADIVARHIVTIDRRANLGVLPLVAVVSRGFETRRMLVEACVSVGFPARGFACWDDATPTRLVLWDAPVLEADWIDPMIEPARRRAVVAMMGFADRRLVSEVKRAGASACLDSPCDLADLAFVLARLSDRLDVGSIADGPHLVPPPRMGLRVVRPPVADRPPQA